ncbi:MAG TPA: preprotein translocase subunit SecE [Candidatus Flavonifractor merdipullorum]|uniref:Protein translocase subunit SecE n=1 Tax=Candidatus Flavonifractor merdipullorum TaxID=2838590 RepID=A0A9D1RV10_9FIRM|nr:preprotein translocase subunit SecE [Candidatus Flavonifractor merdipullorum]
MSENEKLEQTAAGKTKADKAVKKDGKSKPGVFARMGKWFREMKSELKKVQWPTAKQTFNNTVIVIVCCIVVGICIGVFDMLAERIISALINLF